ncbi:hypothetical protein MGA5115_01727 [Marinomonas gallaica]|uniref:Uncharacterized protein n=1 Tax=Marinomonas gallaica TaxID=1806667 RepID=A0A1C3JQT6_9GAMM|nr:hypothetical protein MGA5115_01727 [Marinomonas gallaica]SBT19937.1 hypothetical protein MGA5116_00520 [Marinomonas gallaica]
MSVTSLKLNPDLVGRMSLQTATIQEINEL